MAAPSTTPGAPSVRVSPAAIASCAVILGLLWLGDPLLLHNPWLTSYHKHAPLTPLYAFAIPVARWSALWFVAASAAFVAISDMLVRPTRVPPPVFVGVLFASALLLPLALFVVRQTPHELGTQFLIYPFEEFYSDAARITNLSGFIAHYVELMPRLSLHGQSYPPGHATLLYLLRWTIGPSVLVAGIVVLGCFATGVVVAYLALRALAGELAARQGTLLLLACPSLLDFSCTSMNAVFLLVAMLAWWLALRWCSPGPKFAGAVLVGVVLLIASCVSFSTFPLGLAVGLFTLVAGRHEPRRALARLVLVGAGYAAAATALYWLTGFSVIACLRVASARNVAVMVNLVGLDRRQLWGKISYGNLVAAAIGAGLALVPAAAVRVWRRLRAIDAWTLAALLTLLTMGVGGLYVMETERTWMFAMPWLAAIAVSDGPLTAGSLRLLLGVGLAQALAMEMMLFTLW